MPSSALKEKRSPRDLESRKLWVEYSQAKDDNFAHADIKQAPWQVVNADLKKHARQNCSKHLLSLIPYQDLTPKPVKLKPGKNREGIPAPACG